MPSLRLRDVTGFKIWAEILVNNRDEYTISDASVLIDFLGEGDSTYLVINVKTDERASTEYVFLAANEKDERKSIVLIFDFLKTLNYSLHELLIWLANADYKVTDIGNRVQANKITISCTPVSR